MGLRSDKVELPLGPKTLGFEEMARESVAFDRAVDASDLVDGFCSGSPWVLSAREAFGEHVDPFVVRTDAGWAPLMRMDTVLGRTLLPLEASWGLSAPFVGEDRRSVVKEFAKVALERRDFWDAMFLSGLTRGAPDFTAIVHSFGRHYRLGLGRPTVRCVASLEGGFDGFLSRRTRKFRKNVRSAQRKAQHEVELSTVSPADRHEALAAYARILAVEERSWKGQAGHGIDDGPMRAFYGAMVPRLAARAELRVTFARSARTGEDLGYVLGGVRGSTYRGLQISFAADARELSVGNLMQLYTVQRLCAEGIHDYDLGTDMDYKRFWAEQRVTTVPLVVR